MDHYKNMDNLINRLKTKIELPKDTDTNENNENNNNQKQILQHKNIYYSTSSNSIVSLVELGAMVILGSICICICVLFYELLF